MAIKEMVQEENEPRFDYRAFLAKHGGATVTKYSDKQTVYAQGDKADALYYIIGGSVKVTIYSEYGKEAVIGILTAGDFFGEGCLDGQLDAQFVDCDDERKRDRADRHRCRQPRAR